MLKNLSHPLSDLDGKALREGDAVVSVRQVAVNALLSLPSGDQPSGEEKARRYELALRLNAGGEQDLKAEDLALIKKLVGTLYLPLVVGQVYRWADQ